MIRKYRQKPRRIEAFQVTAEMLDGIDPWPSVCGDVFSGIPAGYYIVRAHPGCPWIPIAMHEFESDFDEDTLATVTPLRIAK